MVTVSSSSKLFSRLAMLAFLVASVLLFCQPLRKGDNQDVIDKYRPSTAFNDNEVSANADVPRAAGGEGPAHRMDDRHRLLQRRPEFRIKSLQKSNLCLEASSLEDRAPITVQECSESAANQRWIENDKGRFRVKGSNMCIYKAGGRRAQMRRCGGSVIRNNGLTMNAFTDRIHFRNYGERVLSVPEVEGDSQLGQEARFVAGGLYRWTADPPIFVTKDDIPPEFLIKPQWDSTLCVETANTRKKSPLHLRPCDDSKNRTQVWKNYPNGNIGLAPFDGKKCIFKNSTYGASLWSPCTSRRANMVFMYSATDGSIRKKRNGVVLLSTDGDLVTMKYATTAGQMEQWDLVAP